jgi:hypothetical protein
MTKEVVFDLPFLHTTGFCFGLLEGYPCRFIATLLDPGRRALVMSCLDGVHHKPYWRLGLAGDGHRKIGETEDVEGEGHSTIGKVEVLFQVE